VFPRLRTMSQYARIVLCLLVTKSNSLLARVNCAFVSVAKMTKTKVHLVQIALERQ
jgi:hypothetical protein